MNRLKRCATRATYALAASAILGSLFSWLAWQEAARNLPSNQVAIQIANTAVTSQAASVLNRVSAPFTFEWDSVEIAHVRFEYTHEPRDPVGVQATATSINNLRANGWTIQRRFSDNYENLFLATRGDVAVRWTADGEGIYLDVISRTPAIVRPIAGTGFVVGAGLGWWIGKILSRRLERFAGFKESFVLFAMSMAMACLALPTIGALMNVVTGTSGSRDMDEMPYWESFVDFDGARWLTATGIGATFVVSAIALVPGLRPTRANTANGA